MLFNSIFRHMKKIYKLLTVLTGITVIFTACRKEIEIELPPIEPALTVNCLFTPDTVFTVRVGKLLPFNDTVSEYIVDDAVCKIWENGIYKEQLTYSINGFYVSETLKASVGKVYQIEVSHPDFETVRAADTVPEPLEISEVYFVHNTLYDVLDEAYFHSINIRFHDDAQKENYYELRLVLEDSTYDGDVQYEEILLTKTNDLSLLYTGLIELEPASIPFSDELFNGQNYFLSTYYKLPFGGTSGDEIYYKPHNLIVHFNAVSYQYYKFTRQMIMHLRNQESDFFEGIGDPVQMYSNIENGYGIFAAYNPIIDTLHHEHTRNK